MRTVEELAQMVEYMRSLQRCCLHEPSTYEVVWLRIQESRVDSVVAEILGPGLYRLPTN